MLTEEDVERIQYAFKEAREAKRRIADLETALAGIVSHWREFGEMMCKDQTDYGLDERIEAAARLVPDRVAM